MAVTCAKTCAPCLKVQTGCQLLIFGKVSNHCTVYHEFFAQLSDEETVVFLLLKLEFQTRKSYFNSVYFKPPSGFLKVMYRAFFLHQNFQHPNPLHLIVMSNKDCLLSIKIVQFQLRIRNSHHSYLVYFSFLSVADTIQRLHCLTSFRAADLSQHLKGF